LLRKIRNRNRSPSMSSAPLPLKKQTEIEDLAQAIREAIEAEIGELAANLATTEKRARWS
jgi:DNA-binding FadR family transcriptional regulator